MGAALGVFHSADGAWTLLSCCLADPSPNPFRKNVDLHSDFHAVVFAAPGSFAPSPSQVQIVYAVNDGGVIKGSVDFQGSVSWRPLTQGMAIGQAGTGRGPEIRRLGRPRQAAGGDQQDFPDGGRGLESGRLLRERSAGR